MILTILLIGFLAVMAIGVPIGWALGISGLFAMILIDIPLSVVPQKIFSGMDVFPLICLPFFILAGEIMGYGGMTTRLLKFCVLLVGRVRGGLAQANVVASMLFGGITGSAIADASALGSIEIPMMKKNGYSASFAAAITSASACIGPIIPPSIPVVIYANAVSGVSIGGLFAGGMIPGIMVGIALMVASYIISLKRKYPRSKENLTTRGLLIAARDASLALMTPLIILGGIIGGVFTPTEAAAVAVVYSFVVTFFVYRELKLSDLPTMFLKSGMTTAVVMIIIGTSNIFGMVVALEELGSKLEVLIEPLGYYGFLLAINVIFLFVGMFMDQNPAILILAPVFAPIAVNLGIDPIHFGIIVIMNLIIGLITPPLGQVLFVVSPIAKVSFEEVAREVWPFLMVEIVVLFLISYVPFFVLFIPRLLGYAN